MADLDAVRLRYAHAQARESGKPPKKTSGNDTAVMISSSLSATHAEIAESNTVKSALPGLAVAA